MLDDPHAKRALEKMFNISSGIIIPQEKFFKIHLIPVAIKKKLRDSSYYFAVYTYSEKYFFGRVIPLENTKIKKIQLIDRYDEFDS